MKAEATFAMFQAKHNLSLNIADHFTKIVPVMFPDSKIAVQYASGRTKSWAIMTGM